MRRKKRTPLTTSATVLTCIAAGALLSAGPAGAASRGFKLHNQSSEVLAVAEVFPVEYLKCDVVPRARPDVGFREDCKRHAYPIGFEGRPPVGAELHQHSIHDWELKYSFSASGGVQYAASLFYTITDRTTGEKRGYVVYNIQTWSYSNESSCNLTTPAAASHFVCTAHGTTLTFKRK